ncbi:uncharacterized protein EI90DRAFT_287665 [Cantharellus anzutake]|uniref:uncharacterized protein n=1 Tax=Cantharellus anzutake TaxID=1750568 RepID=UPI001904A9F2|nr:uncharacterized protein EI90DRAFT_287665 [Cantharellus anzutake]KAF8316255.1 hypothetical protein EI90DRAFT_287665 [Cantharellus anzutake]
MYTLHYQMVLATRSLVSHTLSRLPREVADQPESCHQIPAYLSSILSHLHSLPTNFPTSRPTDGGSSKKKTPIAAIVGGAAGGVVGLALIAGLIFFIVNQSKKQQRDNEGLMGQPTGPGVLGSPQMSQTPGMYGATPMDPNNYNQGYHPQGIVPPSTPSVQGSSPLPTNNFNGAYNPQAYAPTQGGSDTQTTYTQPQSFASQPQQQYYGGDPFPRPPQV